MKTVITAYQLLDFCTARNPPVTLDDVGAVVFEVFVWGHQSMVRVVVALRLLVKNLRTSWSVYDMEEPTGLAKSLFGVQSNQAPWAITLRYAQSQ